MDKRTTWKRIGSLFLTLAMVLTMSVTALPVFAASGGNISVTFDPKVEGLTGTTFNVYKVGGYDRYTEADKSAGKIPEGKNVGDSYIVPDANVMAAGIDSTIFSSIPDSSNPEWEARWLAAAATLKPYADKFTKVNDSPVSAAAGATTRLATVSENGIYLIIGETVKVGDDYWWPLPVLTQVLNGDSIYTFDQGHVATKMDSKPVVYTHNVKKIWNDNDNEKGVRPTELKVDIMYGTVKIDTVTLNEGNNWNYTWKTTESGDKIYSNDGVATEKLNAGNKYSYTLTDAEIPEGDHVWTAVEVFSTDNKLLYNYYVQEQPKTKVVVDGAEYEAGSITSEDEVSEFTTLVNTFDNYNLVIKKDLKSFITNGGAMNASVAFDVTGYALDASGKEVQMYHTQTGIVFDKPGQGSVELKNIPVHLTRIVVKELKSSNYSVAAGTSDEIEFTTPPGEDKTYTADFTNEHKGDEPVIYTGSIVNKYSKGEKGEYTFTPAKGQAQ